MTGTHLLHYEVLEKLGEGGMGVVYKARDTTLGRFVAIKVLPQRFISDHEMAARFAREARTLASLSHSNIAAVYGLDEADGRKFLALELAEGETLSHRISRGRIPVREALNIARQIAEGMEAAHEKGIIHRDLKPSNVMLSAEGKVKILDFGLAKVFEQEKLEAPDQMAPTVTVSAPGAIIGTTAYMSPEQARGRPAGKRSDIWGFGCVLFEMLSGERAFQGETVTDTLAKILEGRPRFEALPAEVPRRILELLKDCLAQDPQKRLHDVGDARLEIERVLAGTEERLPAKWSRAGWVASALVAGVLAGAIGASWFLSMRTRATEYGEVSLTEIDLGKKLEIAFEGKAAFAGFDGPMLDISPDGKVVALVGIEDGTTKVFLRRLDNAEIRPVEESEGALHVFFSPDGNSVGFLSNDKVKTVSTAGGRPRTLCGANSPVLASWSKDGNIYFSERQGTRLSRVPENGGKTEQLFEARPECFVGRALPDGRHALVTCNVSGVSADRAEIRLVPMAGGEGKRLIESGYDGRYVEPGHLLFGRSGELYVSDLDAGGLTVRNSPRRVVSNVRMHSLFPYVQAGVSDNGIIVFATGGDAAQGRPTWVDRAGKAEATSLEERVYGQVSLSDDGKRIAIHVADTTDYVLVQSLVDGHRSTIRGQAGSGFPRISPTGKELAYSERTGNGGYELMWQKLDTGSQPVRLLSSTSRVTPTTWSPDEKAVGEYEWPSMRAVVTRLEPQGSTSQVQELAFKASSLTFAPSKDWLATRNSLGEIVIRNLNGDRVFQITSQYATEPLWCARTGELFYREGNRWFATKVRFEPSVEWEKPRLVFETDFIDTPGVSYALSPDGQRLLVVKRVKEMPRDKIMVLQNWQKPASR